MFRLSCLGLLLAAPAVAGPLDGVFDISPEACAQEVSDARITITGSEMRFYESVCTLGAGEAVPGIPTAWFHDLTCEGEGETWRQRVLLALIYDGSSLIYLGEGTGYESVRCN